MLFNKISTFVFWTVCYANNANANGLWTKGHHLPPVNKG